jgi:hypothetical protein
MFKEALETLLKLSRAGAEFVEKDSRIYSVVNDGSSKGQIALVKPPLPESIPICTLQGVKDLISLWGEDKVKTELFILVDDYETVKLVGIQTDKCEQRRVVAIATCVQTQIFKFGEYLGAEDFSIQLQSRFAPTDDRETVQLVVSQLTSNTVATSMDDGFSQEVVLKQGPALKKQATLKPRVTLAPYRTFREIDQPVSEFILRVKQFEANDPPKVALFEADGGRWKIDAMKSIAEFFDDGAVEVIS